MESVRGGLLSLYTQQVLGYSATQFGLAMLAISIPAVAGSFAAGWLVSRIGFMAVSPAGLVVMGIGLALLTRVPVDGSYVADLLVPLMVIGLGFGVAGVAASIAALAGISEEESGAAAGIEESTFQIGSPLGLAILSTIAVSRMDQLLERGAEPAVAQTEAFQLAIGAAIGFVALALVVSLALLRGHGARTGVEIDANAPADAASR